MSRTALRYKQCKLVKDETTQISWIPKKFAVKGRILILKKDPGWLVTEVYNEQTAKELEEQNKAKLPSLK